MPFSNEPSVIHLNGCDYWRTWFLDDCEEYGIFGANQKHLGLMTLKGYSSKPPNLKPYDKGTLIYLENAPYFSKTKTHHRICGPYEVQAIPVHELTDGCIVEYETQNGVIIWFDKNAKNGPWLDKNVTRVIETMRCSYKKLAREFNFFPYRFAINKHSSFSVTLKAHMTKNCIFCGMISD